MRPVSNCALGSEGVTSVSLCIVDGVTGRIEIRQSGDQCIDVGTVNCGELRNRSSYRRNILCMITTTYERDRGSAVPEGVPGLGRAAGGLEQSTFRKPGLTGFKRKKKKSCGDPCDEVKVSCE